MNPSSLNKMHAVSAMVLLSSAWLSGCTTVAPAAVEPIETTHEGLLDQVEFELQITDIILLNPYLEQESPRANEFEAARLDLSAAAEILVDYSLSLIEVVRSDPGESGVPKVGALFEDTYRGLMALPFVASQMDDVDLDTLLTEVAEQPDFTRALRTVQPATQGIAIALARAVDDANTLFDQAFEETYDKIIDEHRAFNAYADRLVLRRNKLFEHLLLVEAARDGDGEAWRQLLDADDELRRELGGATELSVATLGEAEDLLLARLDKIMNTWDDMEPSWAFYQGALEELYQVDSNVRNVLKVARYVIEEWEREQREMAAGRPAGFIAVTKDLAYLALKRASRR